MAVWAETNGFDGTAEFLYTHAEEERQHMLKLMRFVNERGGTALVPALSATQTDFNGLEQIFALILEHETRVTASINDVVDTCLSLKDYTTQTSCSGTWRSKSKKRVLPEITRQACLGRRRQRSVVPL